MDLSSNDTSSSDGSTFIARLINRLETTGPSTSVRDDRQSPMPTPRELEISGVSIQIPTEQNISTENLNNIDDMKCSICYIYKGELETIISECNHVFCKDCFFKWLKTNPTCPCCRKNFGDWTFIPDETLEQSYTVVQKKYRRLRHCYAKQLEKLDKREEKLKLLEKKSTELIKQQLRLKSMIEYTKGYNKALVDGNNQVESLPCIGEFRRGYLDSMWENHKFIANELKNFGGITTTLTNKKKPIIRKKTIISESSNTDSTSDEEEILLEYPHSSSSSSFLSTDFSSSSSSSFTFSNESINSSSSEIFVFRGSQ